jgi:hypothetical protein
VKLSPRDIQALPASALVLIGANLIPLVGVVAFGWTVFSILLLYWAENVVIGGFNVLRMAFAQPQDAMANMAKLFLIPFFVVHYGGFATVHGIFILALFGPHGTAASPRALPSAVEAQGIGLGVLAMAVSHAFSFIHNYLMSGEYRRAAPYVMMFQPYARVMILHVTILIGGFLAQTLGAPTVAVVLLIVLKIGVDLAAHLAERRKLGIIATPLG